MKTVLITGANKGIGFETAKQLLQQGYYVFLGCRDINKGKEALQKLHEAGLPECTVVELDVANESSVATAAKGLASMVPALDVLINNAGISGGFPQPASSTPLASIREVFDTNFFGMIAVTQAFLPLLYKSKEPRIVNVTSDIASLTLHNDPSWRYYQFKGASYGPSKSALNAYTVSLAYELKDTAFKVNAVNPGYTATDFNHHSGTAKAEDAASIIVRFATLAADGPNGKFYSAEGETPW